MLFRHARERPREIALMWAADQASVATMDWVSLAKWTTQIAQRLSQEADFAAGGVLCHAVQNRHQDLLVALACQLTGIVEVPIDARGGSTYIEHCKAVVGGGWMSDTRKSTLVGTLPDDASEDLLRRFERRAGKLDPGSDALVLWTSGTSGDPRGVVLSHRSLCANAAAKLGAVPQRLDDLRVTLLSIAHAYARTCDVGTWLLSGCRLFLDQGFAGWQRALESVRPTLCNAVPSLTERMLDEDAVPESLRLLGCGGAAMSEQEFARWRHRGVTVIQGYGLTETAPVISSQTPDDSVPGRVGQVVAGWQTRCVDQRLFVRGPQAMKRYWRDEAATRERIDRHGWLDTGDLVEFCEQTGQLRILGRSDDRMVLRNGYNLDPLWIEQRFASVRGVRTAVLRVAVDGRTVNLWIETDGSPSVTELESIKRSLPVWAQPRVIREFTIPGDRRASLFNRKGAIRRRPMLEFLAEVSESTASGG
jgi:long-chain acyl-CoA synthetase